MYKKIIALSAAIVLGAAGNAYAYNVPMVTFKDVADQSWEKDYVYTLSALGIVEGYPDSGYHPKESLSREAFIKLLATTAKLAVSVPTDYYYKGYDFKGLAGTVDSLILMAYDFTDKVSGSRLPSAPFPLVRDGVDRALAQGVPADKLVLGISKQANQWVTAGGKTTYTAPDIPLVEKRLLDPNAVQTFSLPYFLNLIRYQEGGVSNEIYYEDSQSIAKKIWLAKVYGLKGISLWYMGRFTPSDWDVIAKR